MILSSCIIDLFWFCFQFSHLKHTDTRECFTAKRFVFLLKFAIIRNRIFIETFFFFLVSVFLANILQYSIWLKRGPYGKQFMYTPYVHVYAVTYPLVISGACSLAMLLLGFMRVPKKVEILKVHRALPWTDILHGFEWTICNVARLPRHLRIRTHT